MNAAAPLAWTDANQHLLAAEFAALRAQLGEGDDNAAAAGLAMARAGLPEPAAIDQLTTLFGLSAFERSVLLLAAGVEMDSALARLVPRLSFGVALAALAGAHWSALAPLAPLRAWRLVELDETSPSQARIRIDERILHDLAGVNQMDARLVALLQPVGTPGLMADSHRRLAAATYEGLATAHAERALVQLFGNDDEGRRDVAAAVAAAAGRTLYQLALADIPAGAVEQEALAVLWQREAILLPAALTIDAGAGRAADAGLLNRFAARLRGLVFVGAAEPLLGDAWASVRVDKPAAHDQTLLWRRALGLAPADQAPAELAAITGQFRLSAAAIERHAGRIAADAQPGAALPDLWQACRLDARPRLDDLAQRIEAGASWDDLILPPAQTETLHQLASQVRQRHRVHGEWGFDGKGQRGLGISALFCGESGVGKTLACEVLANELLLDLYRIDLSGVVSKYIGETEKNLRRVFDAAEESGAILLFDEADALFGKRSEVKDSHDRYANIEVSYLLQRMEAYRGLAVLTTNQRAALDPAFLRRLRFVVQFPFPDLAQREAIWRRAFPPSTPLNGVDPSALARLQMAGGHIRNIALNAAFLAAQSGEPVSMAHLAHAARQEAAKLEKPLGEQAFRGWSP